MKHKLLLTAILACATAASSLAQSSVTVNYSAGLGQRDILGVSGAPLADGNYVSIGYFDAGFNVASFSNNLLALAGAWNEFGSTTIRTIFGQPGRFSASQSSLDPAFDNQKIYIWVFQTSNNGAPNASYSNVTGFGIYSSSTNTWGFPAQGAFPPSNTTSVFSSDVNQTYHSTMDANHLMLQPVPEPGTIALGLLAAGSLLVRRLRRT